MPENASLTSSPLLAVKLGSNRAAYTAGWWQLINWDDVEYRVTMALQGKLPMIT